MSSSSKTPTSTVSSNNVDSIQRSERSDYESSEDGPWTTDEDSSADCAEKIDEKIPSVSKDIIARRDRSDWNLKILIRIFQTAIAHILLVVFIGCLTLKIVKIVEAFYYAIIVVIKIDFQ